MSIMDIDEMINKEPKPVLFADMYYDLKRAHENNWNYFNAYYKKGFRFDVERRGEILKYDCEPVHVTFYFSKGGSMTFNFPNFEIDGKELTLLLFYDGILRHLPSRIRELF